MRHCIVLSIVIRQIQPLTYFARRSESSLSQPWISPITITLPLPILSLVSVACTSGGRGFPAIARSGCDCQGIKDRVVGACIPTASVELCVRSPGTAGLPAFLHTGWYVFWLAPPPPTVDVPERLKFGAGNTFGGYLLCLW